jgi:hypothetical protein
MLRCQYSILLSKGEIVMKDNPVAQWLILGLSVTAFILLLKFGAGFLPQQGPIGSIRTVIASI